MVVRNAAFGRPEVVVRRCAHHPFPAQDLLLAQRALQAATDSIHPEFRFHRRAIIWRCVASGSERGSRVRIEGSEKRTAHAERPSPCADKILLRQLFQDEGRKTTAGNRIAAQS